MPTVQGYAAASARAPLEPFEFKRRDPGDHDVVIDIHYCGICHTDIHQTRNEWGGAMYPMVPGHEIVGRVSRTGAAVKRFKAGDTAGVGCYVDSDRTCRHCLQGLQQFCSHIVWTYNSRDPGARYASASVPGTVGVTYGGYSTQIVVDENYVLKIPAGLPPEKAAPLLCAGITTYSPLRHWKVGQGQKVGVMGLGGLGHMAVKLATSLGAAVTVFSHSKAKSDDAERLGARRFVLSSKKTEMAALAGELDFIIDTISTHHEIGPALQLLRPDGTMVFVGVPPEALTLHADALIMRRRRLAGSLIGGIPETQEMLEYCASHAIVPEIEVIPGSQINQAYDRILAGDVRYRFVIDLKNR